MRRRLLIAASVLLFLVGILAALWNVFDWPPPRLILKYGLPKDPHLTGSRWSGATGITWLEVAPGYCRVNRLVYASESPDHHESLVRRVLETCFPRMATGKRSSSAWLEGYWVEAERPYWISRDLDWETIKRYIDHYRANGRDGSPQWSEVPDDFLSWVSRLDGCRPRLPSQAELDFAAWAGALDYPGLQVGISRTRDGVGRRTIFGAVDGDADVSETSVDMVQDLKRSCWEGIVFLVLDEAPPRE